MSSSQLRKQKIKGFEQKILNQSLCDIRFYDKLADYLLECCHAEAKPNTLSFFSFFPLFILSFIATGPSTASFLLTIFCLLIHQILDIANKKQAYRLSKFSLATYFIDHLFDSLSCCYIVFIISRLLSLNGQSILSAVFFFGMLPFYLHHLAMYNNDYMVFPIVSPTTEGILQIRQALYLPKYFSSQQPFILLYSRQKYSKVCLFIKFTLVLPPFGSFILFFKISMQLSKENG